MVVCEVDSLALAAQGDDCSFLELQFLILEALRLQALLSVDDSILCPATDHLHGQVKYVNDTLFQVLEITYLFILYVGVFCLHIYMYAMFLLNAQGGQKRLLFVSKLELLIVVRCRVGGWNFNLGLL